MQNNPLNNVIKQKHCTMMKNIQQLLTRSVHSDHETDILLEELLNKLTFDDLVFLLRMFQRERNAKYRLAKIIKKIFQKNLS